MTEHHKFLDAIQHLSVFIAGVFAVFGAIVSFWWRDRNSTRNMIRKNMEVVMAELKEIREEIKQDAETMRAKIADNSKNNHEAHADIIKTMNTQHTNTIKKMLDLHS